MKKYFVVSDIHGNYDEFIMALERNYFDISNPNHHVIVNGDIFDGDGKKVLEVIDYMKKLQVSDRLTFVVGNHDIAFRKLEDMRLSDDKQYVFLPSEENVRTDLNTFSQILKFDVNPANLESWDDFIKYYKKDLNSVCEWVRETSVDFVEIDNYFIHHSGLENKIGGNSILLLAKEDNRKRIIGHFHSSRLATVEKARRKQEGMWSVNKDHYISLNGVISTDCSDKNFKVGCFTFESAGELKKFINTNY